MSQEIERKFLMDVDGDLLTQAPRGSTIAVTTSLLYAGAQATQRAYISQNYLRIDINQEGDILEEERLRRVYPITEKRSKETYYHTLKIGQGELRGETEERLRKRRYNRLMLTEKVGNPINKIRQCARIGEHTLEIDTYLDELSGLVVCEIEFPDLETSRGFDPNSLDGVLGREVTNNPAYSNANLALSGRVPLKLV